MKEEGEIMGLLSQIGIIVIGAAEGTAEKATVSIFFHKECNRV